MSPPLKPRIQRRLRLPAPEPGTPLLDALRAGLEARGFHASEEQVLAHITLGAVYIGRQRVTEPNPSLRGNAPLEIHFQDPLPKPAPPLTAEQILFHDEHLIAVTKPPGLPTQATLDNDRDHLFALVGRHLGNTYVGLHHRLDQEASGVVLFTTSRHANPAIAKLFQTHTLTRTYLAITTAPLAPPPSPRWERRDPLAKQRRGRALMRCDPRGQEAHTRFSRLDASPQAWLVEASPQTGRTHQIRVHLTASNLPLLGDARYAPRDVVARAPRLMLHATRLELPHPVLGSPLTVDCPPPQDFMNTLQTCMLKLP